MNQRKRRVLIRIIRIDKLIKENLDIHDKANFGNISVETIEQFEKTYGEGIDFALAHCNSNYHFSIIAAIVKAYYNLDRYDITISQLERFCKFLLPEFYYTPHDSFVNSNHYHNLLKSAIEFDLCGVSVYSRAVNYLKAFFIGFGSTERRSVQSRVFCQRNGLIQRRPHFI